MKCWNPNCDYDALANSAVQCPRCMTDRPRGKPGNSSTERRTTFTLHGREFSAPMCDNVEAGQPCANIGTLSQATGGHGPFYCPQHFPAFRGLAKAHHQRTSTQAQAIAAFLPRPPREPGEEP